MKNEIDMTSGSILKKMLVFSFPLMLSGVLQLLFNACDMIVVGKFCGDNSLGAVGSNGPLINLITNVFLGLAIGANVLVARYFAAKREEDLRETIHASILLSLICGLFLTLIGIVVARPALILMEAPGDVLDLATVYLKIYFIGMPSMMLYNFGSAILRAKGDTKRPLIYLTISGFINVGLNLVFVIKFNMDVAGVAWATVISQYVSAILILICLFREKGAFKLELKYLRLTKNKVSQIVKIGVPAGLQGVMFSISNVLIQSSINTFGEIAVAGNAAALNLEGFVYIAMNAFVQGGLSFESQNVGAGCYDRLKKVARVTVILTSGTGLILGNLAYIFGNALLGIYTDSPETIQYGLDRMMLLCTFYILDGTMDSMGAINRGLGHSLSPMIVTMLGVCVFRIIWIYTVFQIPEFHTLECIYLSYPISWVITTIVHYICYRKIIKNDFNLS